MLLLEREAETVWFFAWICNRTKLIEVSLVAFMVQWRMLNQEDTLNGFLRKSCKLFTP